MNIKIMSIVFLIMTALHASALRAQEHPAVQTQKQEQAGEETPKQELTQQFEGFNLVGYTEGGQKSWDIKGDKADIVGDQVAITNVNANSYGEQDFNLKAKTGTVDKVSGDVKLEENVVITDENGGQMKTDTLEWQRQKDIVKTNDKVTIENEDLKVQGTGLVAHPSIKTAKLKSDVTADIATAPVPGFEKDNRIQITSDGPMELEQAKQRAIFRENVVAIELATGRQLKADLMEIRFDQTNKKITEILCTGNVQLFQDGNTTYSDVLVYRADEQRVVLTGRPKVLIDAEGIDTESIFK